MAKDAGLLVIAITDHDTVNGIFEAQEAGKEFDVRVIPGIEMSVEEHDSHILGYGINRESSALFQELLKFKQGRIEGAKKMLENLKKEGFLVEWDDVLKQATGGVVARPHLARAIIARTENKEKLGGIATVHDFIEKYLANDSPNYVHRTHITAKDAIALLHQAGGVAVWSHPAIHFHKDYDGLERFLQNLISWKIDGLEAFNPSHNEDDVEFINSLVKKNSLLRTAGSDFHEKGVSARSPDGLHAATNVGDFETYGFSTDDIIPRLDDAIAAHAIK